MHEGNVTGRRRLRNDALEGREPSVLKGFEDRLQSRRPLGVMRAGVMGKARFVRVETCRHQSAA